jgi:hypothetical protein
MPFMDLELHGHSDISFLYVNRSGPGMSSTTDLIFYKALGRLHGPWCKQPLTLRRNVCFQLQLEPSVLTLTTSTSWAQHSSNDLAGSLSI